MTEVLNTETGELTQVDEGAIAAEMTAEGEPADEGADAEDNLSAEQLAQIHEMQQAAASEETADDRQAETAKELAKRQDSLGKENVRHWNRIVEVMGDDSADLVPCELCFPLTPGYRWNASPREDVIAAVRVAIGMPDLSNYRPSSTEHVCDDCGGLGKVRTGSTVARYETADCDACAGKGYVKSRDRLNTTPPAEPQAAPSNGEAPAYDDGIKRDMFGTPETDPDYNLMPGARARPTDYWQTHRE